MKENKELDNIRKEHSEALGELESIIVEQRKQINSMAEMDLKTIDKLHKEKEELKQILNQANNCLLVAKALLIKEAKSHDSVLRLSDYADTLKLYNEALEAISNLNPATLVKHS